MHSKIWMKRKAALNAFNRRFKPEAEDISMERVVNCWVVENQDHRNDRPPGTGKKADLLAVYLLDTAEI